VICLAPWVPGEIVGPRRLSGVVVRPLNFTVRVRSLEISREAGSNLCEELGQRPFAWRSPCARGRAAASVVTPGFRRSVCALYFARAQ
jgi:hypothetical protein